MIDRCTNPKTKAFKNYGGRGITVDVRWAQSFEAFLADLGECPDGMTIDRIDNSSNYVLGNVRWATGKEQARNKRNNLILTANGITGCLSELAEFYGVSRVRVGERIRNGWTVEEAFMTLTRKLTKH